jgi:hypothetical protein
MSSRVASALRLSGAINDSHITALIEVARRRRGEPINLEDDA